MNGNAELLNFVYQNSQMGIETLPKLLETVEGGEELKTHMKKQLEGYEKFHEEAKNMLNENGYDEKGIGAFEKLRTYLMMNLQTLTDKTASHIAEMLFIGSNMGIVDAIKNTRKYQGAEKQILNLMDRLRIFEEENARKLKAFI
ncbi:MAG TPA: hypothetical protein IAA44_09395 [Candidatus Blautia avistercoris]|uniref:hypothetical protein n=1 Tax=Blautia sp. An249 TaxID=1965603 RepID=UPI000B39E202|nr:hypothetical protein [Blautia sp. An249]OUO81166.1 hypothetical protein B5F53_00895 [Blautia sp. An249]HIY19602.1 hypothetical protein [Candidatus Blautia avistercoris]